MPREIYFDGVTAFTGHRDYADPAVLYSRLDHLNSKSYMFGGARGIDSDALTYLAQTQPNSERIVVVPNTVKTQPLEAQHATNNYAAKVIELKNTGTDRYFIRNKYMVNNSKRLEAFSEMRKTGGTQQTINYANSRGTTVNINVLTGTNFDHVYDMSEKEFFQTMEKLRTEHVNPFQLKGITIKFLRMKGLPISQTVIALFRQWEKM